MVAHASGIYIYICIFTFCNRFCFLGYRKDSSHEVEPHGPTARELRSCLRRPGSCGCRYNRGGRDRLLGGLAGEQETVLGV